MSGFFGNRGYWLKVGISFFLIFGGFYWSGRRGPEVSPALAECCLRPEVHDGAHIWVHRAKIVAIDGGPDRFIVQHHGIDLEVRGDPGASRVGEEVTLTGWFRRGDPLASRNEFRIASGLQRGDGEVGGRLDLDRIEPLVHPDEIRWFIEGLSIVVLILVLARFVRVFRVRLGEGLIIDR